MVIKAGTVLADSLVEPDSTWNRLVYRTTSLHEWLPETGLSFPKHDFDERGTAALSVDWERVEPRIVALPAGELRFATVMSTEYSFSPNWSIETALDMVVDPAAPVSVEEAYDRFGTPLLALMMFASDRPDVLSREVVIKPSVARAEIRRARPVLVQREWNPVRGFLFRADALPDFEDALARWFELFGQAEQAIRAYMDAVYEGLTFSPQRLLSTVTALESLHRATMTSVKPRPTLFDRLVELRDATGIDPTTIWCTDRGLQLAADSRNYYAHLGTVPRRSPVELIRSEVVATTRRIHALMQACLLRRIGFPASDTEALLRNHVSNWVLGPVPDDPDAAS